MTTPEDALAFGAAFLFFIAIFAVLGLLMVSWTLQLAAGMIATKPSFLACVGTLMGIGAINGAIMACAQVALGPENMWMAAPVTWFATVFMVARLADCGLIKGFFIWIVNSIFATFGIILLMMVTLVPISMVGGGFEDSFQGLAASIEEGSSDEDFEIDAEELPGFQNASYSDDPFEFDDQSEEEPANDVSDAFFESDDVEVSKSSEPESDDTSKSNRVKTRRAKDGSTLNPFFDK